MKQSSQILLALGANLPSRAGDPAQTLRTALAIMHTQPAVSIRAISHFWTTPAHPAESGPDFCNAAAILACAMTPQQVLALLHDTESQLDRQRQGRWSARTADLDLIGWDGLVLPDAQTQDEWRALPPNRQQTETPDQLILPHPRMQDRGFVLAPLAEIAPGWRHPRIGKTVAQMLAALPPQALKGMVRT
ncbi:MAG: 2-amino-4-hydroxy-6-hydroxymethyldihydropteridine diphosphokinase [Paracoccus sp. (in: a-proteobacteria)]|nr:2-amino-4-hydroxy-6-hydroxymethyldihydropteridine diphosphokinase [Paracoccus sp. (in: a-proteobacteria)]MDO5632728.1 2-amino-4-hydroxy-6-hydroxymethyldihydropteridine diphosphokinase [Paracoccus sp. (in: a-proteobacteria)]